jgi:hypothetical protein
VIPLTFLVGCVSIDRLGVDPRLWSEPGDGVEVSRKGVRIGRERMELPSTDSRLIEILGEPDRTEALENRILVWDRLGMFAYAARDTSTVHAIAISFSCVDMYFCPAQPYPGVVVVSGAVFRKPPEPLDLVRQRFRADEFTCFRNVGRYTVSIDCIEGGLGLGTFEIDTKH